MPRARCPSKACWESARMSSPRYAVIVNPDSKRWQAYAQDLRAFWQQRGSTVEVDVVPWSAVIAREGNLDGLPAFANDRPALVRLESPGRDFGVAKQLLEIGARVTGEVEDWAALEYRKGRLVRPGLLYRGFAHVLRGLHESFARRPHLTPLTCPLAVGEMFDKTATCERLARAGIPCPPWCPPSGDVADLLEELRARGWSPAYVKLNTGSSASGIAVVHLGATPLAISSVVRLGDDFYSTRR